jgi:hypothetical protein
MQSFVHIPFAEYGRFHYFLEILCATKSNHSVLAPGQGGGDQEDVLGR